MAKPNIDEPKGRKGQDPTTGLPIRRQPAGSPRVVKTNMDGTVAKTGAGRSTVK